MAVKIIYKDIAPGAAAEAVVNTNDAQSFASPAFLPEGREVPLIASCEHNFWLLDGTAELLAGQSIPFLSEAQSDDKGAFTAPQTIEITFINQHTSLGIFLRFAPSSGDYNTEVTIIWYQGATELDNKVFYPDKPSFFCRNTVTAYDKVIIKLNGTARPYRFSHLECILFGVLREFNIDELRSVAVLQEVDIISSEMAINTLDWTLDSLDTVDYVFQLKQPVEAYDGNRLIGVFYVDGSKRLATNVYDISCIDAIGVLDESLFAKSIYNGYNAKKLIEDILGGDFELEIDSSLESAVVTGYIPDCSRRQALQQVCFAIGAVTDTSGTKNIRVFAAPSSNVKEITQDRTFLGGEVETESIVTAVEVTAHTYTQGTGSSGDDVIEVDGIKYVHTKAITRINNPSVTAIDKQKIIAGTDATLVSLDNVADVAARVYAYYTKRDTLNAKFVLDGEKPGDYVEVHTNFGTALTGNITSMSMTLSAITAVDSKVVGV